MVYSIGTLCSKRKNELNLDHAGSFSEGRDMEIYRQRLAQLLAEEMAERGVSESQIARELDVWPRTLNQWKLRGSVPHDPEELFRLCRKLNTHPNYLLGWSDDRHPQRMSELETRVAELERRLGTVRKSSD